MRGEGKVHEIANIIDEAYVQVEAKEQNLDFYLINIKEAFCNQESILNYKKTK